MVCKQNFNRKLFHEKYQVFTIVLQCSYYISYNMSTNMCDVTKGVCVCGEGGGRGGDLQRSIHTTFLVDKIGMLCLPKL